MSDSSPSLTAEDKTTPKSFVSEEGVSEEDVSEEDVSEEDDDDEASVVTKDK